MEREDRYFSVVAVKHFHAKDAEFFTDYFAPRCTRFFLFTFSLSQGLQSSNSIQFFEYSNGVLVRQKTLVEEQTRRGSLRLVELVFWFVVFAVFFLPKGSWILTLHPPVCVLQSVVRLLKSHKYALMLTEVFRYDLSRITGRLMNYVLHAEARSAECLMYVSPAIEEFHGVPIEAKSGRRHCIRKRWTGGVKRRFSPEALTAKIQAVSEGRVPLVIGYIGLVRQFCGLAKVVDFLEGHEEFRLDVVGEGGEALREECRRRGLAERTMFRGFLSNDEVAEIAGNWFCGAMLFDVEGNVYAKDGEPGKARSYLSLGLPILMTDVSSLVREIGNFRAGIVLETNDVTQIEAGVNELRRNYETYIKGVIAMTDVYDYEAKYDKDFEFMRRP
jgi:glycosyltransferase involved in cell wall biosynthesis